MNIEDQNSIVEEIEEIEEISEDVIFQLKEIVNISPKLEIIVKESLFLQEGLIIKINALGLEENSLRGKKDGITIFGAIPSNDEQNINNIDFSTGSINNENKELIQSGIQFIVKFDIEKKGYFIKDCSHGKGYGTFMKVIENIKIKDTTLVNIGNNYIVFTLGVDVLESDLNDNTIRYVDEKNKILSVKVFMGDTVNYSYVFNQSQTSIIYIGKNESCDIVINDDLVDDFHCCIEYNHNIGWVISDGYNDKKSENGTWICLSEETKICEGMIIQSNQNIYQCHIIE